MTDTTLMMVTYNRLDLTLQTLSGRNGLFDVDPGRDYNLVIVDNGSTDGTRDTLSEMVSDFEETRREGGGGYPRVNRLEVIQLPENKGIAVGRNVALKKADELKTKWYCTIDNDVWLPEGWLQECIDILEANKAFGAIGVNFEPKKYPLVTKSGFTFQEKPAGNLGTALMVFRKQVHQMLGFFTIEYGLYGEEDADFGMRARVAGFKLGYIERMGTHLGEGEVDTGEYREFKTKQHADNLALFRRNCALYANRKKPLYIPYKDC